MKDDIENMLNAVFENAKIPYKITDLFLYRPVLHEPPFENFEPINEATRLASCNPLFIDLDFECTGRRYCYHIRSTNEEGKFRLKEYWCKSADLFPGEKPREIETNMKETVEPLIAVVLKALELACRE